MSGVGHPGCISTPRGAWGVATTIGMGLRGGLWLVLLEVTDALAHNEPGRQAARGTASPPTDPPRPQALRTAFLQAGQQP